MKPLDGLRVLELATGIAGPYAGRLLALLGADVVKTEPPDGDPSRTCPIDDSTLYATSPLFLHLNAGKRLGSVPTAWADVVIDDRVRRRLDDDEIGSLGGAVWASVTARGFEADEAGGIHDELLVQAASGITTVTGDQGDAPLRFPGWQSQYFAGAYTAAAILAALADGEPHHLDVAWVACMATGSEGGFQRFLSTGQDSEPAGAHSMRTFPSGAFACADGHVVPGTVRRKDWELQCDLYGMPSLVRDERFKAAALRAQNHEELGSLIQPWYDAHTKREIFAGALSRGLALGMVVTPSDAIDDEHMRSRGFLGDVDGAVAPVSLCRITPGPAGTPLVRRPLLEGVRVIELTTAWAGPFIGRFLGALGAEVIKVESARQVDGWRVPMRLKTAMREVPLGSDPDESSFDVAPNFNALNRNKRGVSIDLTTADGRDLLLRLVRSTDVVAANYTQRVLPGMRLDYENLSVVRPELVMLSMPALGTSGPYAGAPGYGTIIEGMGGFASRFGYVHEGARVSDTYYPDAVAGIHATFAILAALERRRRTGEGCFIDMSQQEVMWLQLGEAIVHASLHGRDPARMGNGEPGLPGSGILPTADGRWLAVVARTESEAKDLAALTGGSNPASWTATRSLDEALAALRDRRIGAAPVLTYAGAAGELRRDWIETSTHPVTGSHEYLRLPFRIDGEPIETRRPAPRFDEHTDEVLIELAGVTAEDLRRLRDAGVIGGDPRGPAKA